MYTIIGERGLAFRVKNSYEILTPQCKNIAINNILNFEQ